MSFPTVSPESSRKKDKKTSNLAHASIILFFLTGTYTGYSYIVPLVLLGITFLVSVTAAYTIRRGNARFRGLKRSIVIAILSIVGFISLSIQCYKPPLFKAIGTGDISKIEKLADKGYNVNAKINGRNMLTAAFRYPYPNKRLFGDSAKISLTKEQWEEKIVEILEVLIDKGADINRLDPHGSAPIHYAIINCSYRIVDMLIEKGADINLKDKENTTPLDIALRREYKEIVELLCKHGARESIGDGL